MHGEPDHVGVLLLGRGHDAVGGLAQPQVDDLHARVAQHPGHHFDAAVVAVEAELGQQGPDGRLGVRQIPSDQRLGVRRTLLDQRLGGFGLGPVGRRVGRGLRHQTMTFSV